MPKKPALLFGVLDSLVKGKTTKKFMCILMSFKKSINFEWCQKFLAQKL